jgi:hypothetical protein
MTSLHRRISAAAVAIVLSGIPSISHAQSTPPVRPWKEGSVLTVSHIRTLPGQTENYMRYIWGDYAKLMNAEKDAGIITNWSVYTAVPRTANDPDVILVTVYPNMAALDGLSDRTRPIAQRVLGLTPEQSAARTADRERMRKTLGSDLLRQQVASP